MKVFINPGHAPNGNPDPGACGFGLRESDVAMCVGSLLEYYLRVAGLETRMLQSDSLEEVVATSDYFGADIFVSIHCNAFDGTAHGTETLIYAAGGEAEKLAKCVQSQLIDALGTANRGIKERPGLYVLNSTAAPAILVETAFIDNRQDNELLANETEDIARAIARGVTDYQGL